MLKNFKKLLNLVISEIFLEIVENPLYADPEEQPEVAMGRES